MFNGRRLWTTGEGWADLVQVPWRPSLIAGFRFYHLTMNILGLPDPDAPKIQERGEEEGLGKGGDRESKET